ncbi:2-(3-amino-3-carboxypropyl)histidine synthase subunit 1-like [Arachis duranensis]|uniref:2-(3-amino-3-carboxypropyl)histidine synthase subunit 1 n=1 Tax=Arachis duranensis TaxID=130453 RepID=A0A9C6WQY3_ARADU|nr:2-(3-amino-3-carboxypropyl)histidine synthase subunit 1-like [Arachis duranensis]
MEVEQAKPKPTPKRFVKNQIPDSILNDAALNAAIFVLPHNYNFEVHKCVWRVLSTSAKRVVLQFPEGLLIYSLPLSNILTAFAAGDRCYVLGDVTYGACCVDDFSAAALSADLLIHYGHSCLVPIDSTTIPCLYVFVDIKIDVSHLVDTFKLNLESRAKNLVLAGTIQFASAIRAAKPELEKSGFSVLVPQSKPLSAGEVLGCTAPKVSLMDSFSENHENSVLVFVADGRFHLEKVVKMLVCGEDENGNGKSDFGGEYPMDYYSQDGGEWNSSYVKKSSRPIRRISVSSVATSAISQQS